MCAYWKHLQCLEHDGFHLCHPQQSARLSDTTRRLGGSEDKRPMPAAHLPGRCPQFPMPASPVCTSITLKEAPRSRLREPSNKFFFFFLKNTSAFLESELIADLASTARILCNCAMKCVRLCEEIWRNSGATHYNLFLVYLVAGALGTRG